MNCKIKAKCTAETDPVVHFDEQSLLLRKCSEEAFFARGLKVLCQKIINSEDVWTGLSIFS